MAIGHFIAVQGTEKGEGRGHPSSPKPPEALWGAGRDEQWLHPHGAVLTLLPGPEAASWCHRELLWQEGSLAAPRALPSPRAARWGGREEAEQRKEPVAGEGGWARGPCLHGHPQPPRSGMVKSP